MPDLDAHLDAWRTLAAGVPMRSPEWLLTWWQSFAESGDALCVVLVLGPDGTLTGLAPLYIAADGRRKVIRLLGSGAVATNHITWLSVPGWELKVSLAVATCLLELKPDWHRIQLDCVSGDDPNINATVNYLAQKGCLASRTPLHNSWEIALPTTWNEYLRRISKAHRKRCNRMQRQLLDSGKVQVHRVTCEAELEHGFDILIRLHAARWGGTTKPSGFFSDQRCRAFHEKLSRILLKQKQLLLTWLEYEGRPIAVEYQFMGTTAIYSYQAGMDPSITEFAPGNLSIMNTIQFAIAHGCLSFDFSLGNQPYKANWRAVPSARNDITIWHDTLASRIEKAALELRNRGEQMRMRAVGWIKARISDNTIDAWRQLRYVLSGERRSPRKADR